MSLKKGTTIDLTVTSASDPMLVDNSEDELSVKRAPIDTAKLSSKSATVALYYSSSTPRPTSMSTFSPYDTLPYSLTSL